MSPQSKFWDWFVQHQEELLRVEGDQDQLFDQLATKIQEYHIDLTFELGPKGLQRELVISAGIIRQAFSSVVSLVNAAPAFANWQIIAFRPRRIFSAPWSSKVKRLILAMFNSHCLTME